MVHPSKWWSGSCERQFLDLQWDKCKKTLRKKRCLLSFTNAGNSPLLAGSSWYVPSAWSSFDKFSLINTFWRKSTLLFELHGLVRVPENHKPIASTKVCIPEEEDYGINNCKIVCLYVESKRKGQQVETKWPLDSWKRCHPSMREWSRSSRRKMDW